MTLKKWGGVVSFSGLKLFHWKSDTSEKFVVVRNTASVSVEVHCRKSSELLRSVFSNLAKYMHS